MIVVKVVFLPNGYLSVCLKSQYFLSVAIVGHFLGYLSLMVHRRLEEPTKSRIYY